MQYRHAGPANHAALDAVLVSAPGRPTLPVRLTVELLGRARSHLDGPGGTVWDPCCGAGVTLTVLGLLAPGITALVGTDVDPGPLDLARRNLGLLRTGGLSARAQELDALSARHRKPAYAEAAGCARSLVPAGRPAWSVGVADALDRDRTRAMLGDLEPDVVLADLPHGRQTTWATPTPTTTPGADGDPPGTAAFLTAVASVLDARAVLVAVDRGRTVPVPAGVRPLERLRVGHRAAMLLRAGDLHRSQQGVRRQ
ncbi:MULTISPECIES: hypothetical protein [Pseudonocardia]|uniref:23S rRNA (Guanine(2535)-N(1))-methyltransferase n=2 Tax=Pseudonocardia TaxID=1847 RepID=A0A1Y2MXF1_PSEAH|nr:MULTISPECIES: hypothetical protein [Pseudonocardia]OSY39853.1 23S rRNA (guanine(2535)-N(1))-methyltransferase [Pseudonocardia autotrophica]TDN74449.1 RRNA methyltransferase AviRa [Pseudonocardia autotrophica]BBG05216.1 hypothetical protein Pdca_64250 [Pseudonocardia autotrophica]GEC25776.1 hypothetical protein PSA01_28050 [Pseudonocardia saturnea]